MFNPTDPFVRPLANGLVMKSVSTLDDVERLAGFNVLIHGPHTDDMTRGLILHHPHTRPEQWLIVEDSTTGQIVSSLCLIPRTWRYAGVALRAGEQGIVGTLEAYRGRGLVRALNARFREMLDEGGYDLSPIQGIPYFYRQFGYEYALPLEGGWTLPLHEIPSELPPAAQGYTFRPAAPSDLPDLVRLYDEAMTALDLYEVRDEGAWRFLLECRENTQAGGEVWLILDSAGRTAGYWVIEKYGFGGGLTVNEASRLSHPAAMAVLGKLLALAQDRQQPAIRLSCSDTCPLVTAAKAYGSRADGRYAWQIMLPDAARFLRTIGPVLEARLAASSLAGLSDRVRIDLYLEQVELRFEEGRLCGVDRLPAEPFPGKARIHIPPTLLAPLALGWRSHEELHAAFPDVGVWGQARLLVDVLFPKMEAFFYSPY